MNAIGEDDRHFVSMTIDAGVARAVVAAAHATHLCAGHFPDEPLLPGAALVGLMADLAARLFDAPVLPVGLPRCVFSAPVAPTDRITITARAFAGSLDAVEVEVHTHRGRTARATLRFERLP